MNRILGIGGYALVLALAVFVSRIAVTGHATAGEPASSPGSSKESAATQEPAKADEPAKTNEPAKAEATPAPTGHEHHSGTSSGSSSTAPAAKPASGSAAAGDGVIRQGPRGGQVMTITGEVMDPACFLEAGVKSIGPGHFQCAVDCAKSGQTLAIYDRPKDRIYFIAGELPGQNPNDPVINFIHKKVDVTGTVYHRAGVYGIVIAKVELHRAGGSAAAGAPKGAATK